MSGIFGLVHLNEQKAQRQTLELMQKKMLWFQPDKKGLSMTEHAGFGQLLRFSTPEDLFETLPLKLDGILFTFEGRLDNREELCDLLGISISQRLQTSDGLIACKTFIKLGVACCKRLIGEWSFAAWCEKQRKFTLAVSPIIYNTLYYAHLGDTLLFSNDTKGLDVPPLAPLTLDQRSFVYGMLRTGNHTETNSIFKGVQKLPSAHYLEITNDLTLKLTQYWGLDDIEPLQFNSTNACTEAFMEVFTQAVQARLRSYRPVTAFISGGLDSTAVVSITAALLKQHEQQLEAFHSAPLFKPDAYNTHSIRPDETNLVRQIETFIPNLTTHIELCENQSPINAIKILMPWLNEVPLCPANSYWLLSIMQAMQEKGYGTALTGFHGNATISWNSPNTPRAPKHFIQHGAWPMVKNILAGIINKPLRNTIDTCLHWPDKTILQSQRIRALGLHHTVRKEAWVKLQNSVLKNRLIFSGVGVAPFNSINYGLLHGTGIEKRSPTGDIRVIKFCLGLNESMCFSGNTNRMVVRRAMSGRLPTTVVENFKTGRQASDITQRIRHHKNEINPIWNNMQSSPILKEWVKMERLQQTVGKILLEDGQIERKELVFFMHAMLAQHFLSNYAC